MPSFFKRQKVKYFITANCPSIVKLIEKFHPELVPNLAPLVSPMIATAMVVKELYGQDVQQFRSVHALMQRMKLSFIIQESLLTGF